ncbi:S8 family serine peptidase [Streptomyces sp. NBC_00378]|uniref:S8 family peptidase n=1 Tax=Streptomyces sp. NBC_00378 TaxID=2975732 RepID=UPI00225076D9|nr:MULTISPECIES: S8 family serine peptidase [unclassified Streptomyces]MCX5109851.1 S8 family serine peptidase [Streptomyces sp. NBC_00378]
MTSPAVAQPDAAQPSGTGARTQWPPAQNRLTLITGDVVTVDAKGRVMGFRAAEGREHIPVQRQIVDGHTLLVPADAHRLISSGKLDRRLFDVTELSRAENRRAQKSGLKLIVSYRGAKAADAKAEVRAAGSTRVDRTLKTLNAQSVITPQRDAQDIWQALTSKDSRGAQRTTAAGIDRVWLNGVRRASLDKSVPQIGTPAAWKAGYTGKGVKIAVLDTGVDATHPDLAGQILDTKNFTASPDAKDRVGHGTHVSSIAAGTGAKSGGKFKGVAPDAKLLEGKVLDDNGFGDDSGILAGMEWAVAQGADVINLSLGGSDTPEVDPLEAAVNKLSADKGVLFAIAAGNEGDAAGTVGSPGSADAALTVGAVDDKDKLADFSSRGPRVGDGAIKPDVTAPGVDITAAAAPGSAIDQEVGQNPPGYLTISGTSMATPHVAGAAALLKQQHPEWKYAELKGALTASTKPGAYSPFEQGTGRIAVDRAIAQTVVADPVSLSFGVQQWPHTDDTPVTKTVTYRNLGTTDVTLDLAVTATGPGGKPVPAGFFGLGADKVTVPAGGTADVPLTVNTKLGGTADGTYSAYVVGTGGGQSVRTAAAVEREIESYDLTVRTIGRDGKPAEFAEADLFGLSGTALGQWLSPTVTDGMAKVRVPRGGYTLNGAVTVDPEDYSKGTDWLSQPKLDVTKNLTVTLDARKAKPVNITVPATGTESLLAAPDLQLSTEDTGYTYGWILDTYKNFRTAHFGPAVTDGSLSQHWISSWTKGTSTRYDIAAGGPVTRAATGFERKYTTGQLAKVGLSLGSPAKGKSGEVSASGSLPGSDGGWGAWSLHKIPGTVTSYVSTADKVKWSFDFDQDGGVDEDGYPVTEASYSLGAPQGFKAGKSYTKKVNTAVFGPAVNSEYGILRDGNYIVGMLPLVADGAGNFGGSAYSSAKTVLYRNGKKLAQNDDPLTGLAPFTVSSAAADYRLTTSMRRSAALSPVSTRIDASWTFRSKRTSGPAMLPISTVRFTPNVTADSRVTAGRTASVPVTVQGAAAGKNLKSLTVYVSYDAGKTWKKSTVKAGKISVKNPAKGKSISYRANVTDKKGNKSSVSIYNAYFGK